MGLFERIFAKKDPLPIWEEIKNTEQAYPVNSISLFTLNTKNGLGTGWVNKGYKKYPYKRNCPYNFLIKVDLTDEISNNNEDLDTGTIEDFFVDELRKICIVHMISRLTTEKGITIEMYLEELEEPKKYLEVLITNPSRLVSFEIEVNNDPLWLATRGLMKIS